MSRRQTSERGSEWFIALLLLLALVAIQILIGGTRLLFAYPSYALLGVAAVIALFVNRAQSASANSACLLTAALFTAFVAGRALLSPVDYIARPDLYSVGACLVVYMLTAMVVTSPKVRLGIILALILLALANVVIGAIQFGDGNNYMPISFLQRYDYGKRASGFYICPNHLAGFFEMLGGFCVSIACWSRLRPWAKLIFGYLAAMLLVGEALTGSRGGYLSIAASALIFSLLSFLVIRAAGKQIAWRITLPVAAALLAAAVVGVALFAHNDVLSNRAQNVFDKQNMRLDLWHAALQQWKLQPLSGTGSATYLYYGRHFRTDRMQLDPVQVHNDYLALLAEYGLAGALVFSAMLFAHLRHGWRNFMRLGPKRIALSSRLVSNAMALNIGAITGVAALIVHGAFDFNMHIPANALLMAFLLGILANPGVAISSDTERTRGALWPVIVSAVIGLVLIVQAARLLPPEYFTERARVALRDHNPIGAVQEARRALQWETHDPALHEYLGRARMQLSRAANDDGMKKSFLLLAADSFQNARALAPLDDHYMLDLAFAEDALGPRDEAEALYQKAIAWDPRSIPIRSAYEAHRSAMADPKATEKTTNSSTRN
ncbi:MAG: O-antigen ligase family protein [Verrucomicrobiota bacterium]|nr:O-antigen ligase family protein [Verrucomicrobiota bacterium]